MPEPEAEIQATANLSPVSPSPVHSATSLAVPALQETVDTIDAMVAAAAAAADAAKGTASSAPNLEPISGAGDDDIVDDDSLNDPYGEDDTEAAPQPEPHPQQELPDSNDDYAKTFDSPIGPEEGEDGDIQPEDVSSMPRESNQVSLSSDHLTSRPSEVSHAVPESSSSAQPGEPVATAISNASSEAHLGGATTPATSQPSNQPASSPATAKADSNAAGSPSASTDIQRLVADLTAPAEPSASADPSTLSAKGEPSAEPGPSSSAFPSSASLPPRPPQSQAAPQSYASQHHPGGINASIPSSVAAPPTPGQPSTYVAAGAPVTAPDALGNFATPPGSGLHAPVAITSMNAPPYPPQSAPYTADRAQDAEYQRQWDQFLADERQYMSEAKWDRFPEGSRIFIGTRSASGASKNGAHIFSTGNLSSDKVSKRDVFDLFHRFGRLAQISLKSAYGFVQYHSVEEGRRAMENLQGIEIKGRRIHLEVSRVQDKTKKERARSPERNRGRDSGRRNERHGHQNRDDYRPGRGQSPRRNDYQRDESYGRDRGFYDGGRGRGRSHSPGYGRNDKDNYRRRSPSPYGRPRHEGELDLPRRYGADVPDVQIILQPDVNRDFVNWVEQAFKAKGLRSEVMYLHPRIPKDVVVQRQAAEGVHAVVDLDLRAQNLGRIPVQAFDRSAGSSNVRFDQYVDLEPSTAAEVIIRAKASGGQPSYGQSFGGNGGYSNPYGGQPPHQPPTSGFPAGPPQSQYGQQPSAGGPDIASLVGQLNPAALQQLLSQIQPGGQNPAHPPTGVSAPAAPQVDIQAILGSLGGNATAQQPPPNSYGAPYGAQPPSNGAPPNGDAAVQVQNIMAQLARYRQ
ncbi:nuclear polyadenylated RNA-binding protein 3 [Fusarium falciforme]|uniref:Nuclear polyadenylated RNA-binding protein 3 n=1 Tax=Fusarium falciforme TaxID=195108 RepID=A0A9W8V012_9HYPO|nr:nuclear polyadenylated RNA-binding protein 3 [Fusarium falciforme]KAJ4199740.1 nuclear polyadenylated RNA-binding protein 3 [Fusarium falciforme]